MSEGVARIRIRDCSMMHFEPRPSTFFAEGTSVKCIVLNSDSYTTQKFGSSYGVFEGWTYFDEEGNMTDEKRFREESVPLSEFDITIHGKRVNDLTYLELVSLL